MKTEMLLIAALGISAALATRATATEFCSELTGLTEQAALNFLDVTTSNTPTLAGAAFCAMSRVDTGGRALHCAWPFEYRDPLATAAFDGFAGDILSCANSTDIMLEDRPVNHPDTFVQRQFAMNDIVISLSLKDKTALGETYVFVGILGRVPGE